LAHRAVVQKVGHGEKSDNGVAEMHADHRLIR
jgi:hypothetical protein